MSIERMLWVVEQFFVSDSAGKIDHELGLYFLIAPLDTAHIYDLERTFHTVDGEVEVIFQWFKLDDLANVSLYPSFLQTALQTLPLVPEHIVLPSSDFEEAWMAYRSIELLYRNANRKLGE